MAFASALAIDQLSNLISSESCEEHLGSIRNEFQSSGGTNTVSRQEQLAALAKREWLSGIANASLVIPFALALAVIYFAFKELSLLRAEQKELYKPIIEQQMLLLKEDRERLQQVFEKINLNQLNTTANQPRASSRRSQRRR